MIKRSELLRLAGVVSVAGALTLVGLATAEARDLKVVRPAAVAAVQTAAVESAPVATPALVEEKTNIGQATADQIVQAPGCRKVKVIYAGYGESERAAGCPAR